MNWPESLLLAAAVYLGAGALFAVPFVLVGTNRLDEAATRSGWGFRAMIAPGAAALWPLLLTRWVRARGRSP